MRHSVRPVHLLLIEKLHIHADGIDLIHEKETDESVDEVLVLSRHAAKWNSLIPFCNRRPR